MTPYLVHSILYMYVYTQKHTHTHTPRLAICRHATPHARTLFDRRHLLFRLRAHIRACRLTPTWRWHNRHMAHALSANDTDERKRAAHKHNTCTHEHITMWSIHAHTSLARGGAPCRECESSKRLSSEGVELTARCTAAPLQPCCRAAAPHR